MNRIVVFTFNNARVVHGHVLRRHARMDRVLIDPDLSQVLGVEPEYWKREDGHIIEMTPFEKASRKKLIQVFGANNDWQRALYPDSTPYFKIALLILSGISAIFLFHHFIKISLR